MGLPTVSFILGTRPEIIKLAPVVDECRNRDIQFDIIHTGQHYSSNLDKVFFEQFELPEPDYHLDVGSGTHGQQTGEMLGGIDDILRETSPDYVVVQGDTNSTLAGSLSACKLSSTLCHVEAGLRSYDREMPEEINRVLADHAADLLFPPTPTALENLTVEGISGNRTYVTGNTVVDALYRYRDISPSGGLEELGVTDNKYLLLTIHRAENVDNPERFAELLNGVGSIAKQTGLPCIYPIHPRASEQLTAADIEIPEKIRVVESRNYLEFISLEDSAALILTDSGGVQEEACVLNTPCVTLRNNTERPETVNVGSNVVAGIDAEDIRTESERMLQVDTDWENPYGDGKAANRILDRLIENH